MAVYFHEKAPSFHIKDKKKLKQWIKESVVGEHFVVGDINFVFETDEKVYQANVKYLNHDWYTDVISFDYKEGKIINGDILISVDRVEDNAAKYGVSKEREIQRVMIHGVLHLCGYDDDTEKERDKMRKLEDLYLRLMEKIMKKE
ncbi:MAG: rRNA maturation RNase YbeY [Bacteroidales bacterium]|nr:rRNA maturation RNase YbeY [Bacteroidales bacterium]